MRTLIAFMLLFILSPTAMAQTPVMGFGKISCGTWLESSTNEGRGAEWFLGFWAGGNALAASANSVGASTDADGLVDDAKARCRASETSRLIEIATGMFKDYLQSGR